MKVMIAGGGTGGHVYPGIALYEALKRIDDDIEVLFVGARTGMEGGIFSSLGLPHVLIAGRGVRGASLVSKMGSPFVFVAGIFRAIKVILSFKPDVVIGTGGFASVAVVVASVLCGKKRVLQEQNSVPGMANRMLSRFAHLMLLSYGESRRFFSGGVPCAVVGNPLRAKAKPDRASAARFFDLRSNLPTVLVFGGSRGAHTVNVAARIAIERILEQRDVQFIWLTGEHDYEAAAAAMLRFSEQVRVRPFLEDIQHAYSLADVAISRAGASAVFELARFGVPTVFVPYPYAADDHQRSNVRELAEQGAAIVVDNADLDGKKLTAIILSLLDDEPRRVGMAKRFRAWAPTDADRAGAERILELMYVSLGCGFCWPVPRSACEEHHGLSRTN